MTAFTIAARTAIAAKATPKVTAPRIGRPCRLRRVTTNTPTSSAAATRTAFTESSTALTT